MIKNIFIKQEANDYSGDDMSKFKSNLIDKLEGYDHQEILAKIQSTYMDLKEIVQKDIQNLIVKNDKQLKLAQRFS